MKLIKIDETLIEIPDHNYTELVSLHKKAFGSYDSYIDLRKLANIRQEYFDYIDKLLNIGKYPNIPLKNKTKQNKTKNEKSSHLFLAILYYLTIFSFIIVIFIYWILILKMNLEITPLKTNKKL